MLKDVYIGEDKVSRTYTGEHLVHPSPVMDGLVLWYDFMGRRNSDAKRGIAEDLSGNGNHGTLTNFAYQPGSGYEGDGLRFDGVDDVVITKNKEEYEFTTLEGVFNVSNEQTAKVLFGTRSGFFGSSANNGFEVRINNLSSLIYAGGNGEVIQTYTNSFSRNVDVHVCFVLSQGLLTLYQNSLRVLEVAYPNSKFVEDIPLLIGARTGGDQYAAYTSVKLFRRYNRALTPSEIAHNYQLEKERWNL